MSERPSGKQLQQQPPWVKRPVIPEALRSRLELPSYEEEDVDGGSVFSKGGGGGAPGGTKPRQQEGLSWAELNLGGAGKLLRGADEVEGLAGEESGFDSDGGQKRARDGGSGGRGGRGKRRRS